MMLIRVKVLLAFIIATLSLPVVLKAEVVFPTITGWEKSEVKAFDANTLWDYINGASEGYLSYSFKLLEVCDYTDGDNYITVEVYQHASPEYAFGIYSTERPRESEFLDMGAEGYYEDGRLNFFMGNYYVKMSASGNKAINNIKSVGKEITASLEGIKEFPKGVKLLPKTDKVEKSEMYVAKNVLGYSFLNHAFLADYASDEGNYRIFLFEKNNPETFKSMMAAYFDKCGQKTAVEPGFYSLNDPYNGTIFLEITDDFAIGTLDVEKKKYAKKILISAENK